MSGDITVTANYHSLKDRVVIITGGGQGIGRGYARHFAAQGAVPVIAELNAGNALAVKHEIEAEGGRALAFETDVGSMDSVSGMVEATLSATGPVTEWLHCLCPRWMR